MRAGVIRTGRLDLPSLSPAFLEALLAGERDEAARLADLVLPDDWPDAHDEAFLRLREGQLRADPAAEDWAVRALVLRADGRPMVGHAGFHGPPGINAPRREGAVELGYTVFQPYRGRGYASEAVRALIRWAHGERGIRRFVASVAPGNEPSLAIVRRLGFVEIGRHWDEEDGEELEFELVLP
jgi:ribosomal-protein-alanine N-acetyltransferase